MDAEADVVDQQLLRCDGCGRTFNPKALEKHRPICRKVFQTKRQTFNTSEQRLAGTGELEACSVRHAAWRGEVGSGSGLLGMLGADASLTVGTRTAQRDTRKLSIPRFCPSALLRSPRAWMQRRSCPLTDRRGRTGAEERWEGRNGRKRGEGRGQGIRRREVRR